MNVLEWGWPLLMVATVSYWVSLFCAWFIYTTRPSTQARARERAFSYRHIDPATGETTVVFEQAINVGRLAMIIVVPPVMLALGWLFARAS